MLTPSGSISKDEFTLPVQCCGDYFIVPAVIDNRGPYPMLLDTGAGMTVISPNLSREVGIIDSIERIKIGRFHASGNIPCEVHEVDHLSDALGMTVEGILAYGVFNGVLLTYDYPKQEVRVQKGTIKDAELAHPGVVNASKGTRPFVRAAIDGIELTVLLDTGSNRGLKLTMLDRFAFAEPPRPTGVEVRISGLSFVRTERLENDLELGPLILRRALVTESASVDLVGQRILRGFVVTFDQTNSRVRIKNPNRPLNKPIEFPSLYGPGIAFDPRGDRLVVRKVFEGTAAHRAGVRVDDEILSINGTAIADRGCEHLEFKPTDRSKPMELVIERNGNTLSIDLSTDILVR